MVGDIGKLAYQEGFSKKLEALRPSAASPEAQEQKRVAQEFASFLILEVLKAMRASIPQGGLFEDESLQKDIFTTLADTEISRAMARRDDLGLSKMVERALEGINRQPFRELKAQSPADGVISSGFGLRADPLKKAERFHQGVDIAAPAGSPIRAVAPGKVVHSGWAEGYGYLVALDHGNGMVTRYGHNAVNLVSLGEEVSAGQQIAMVGGTGRSTGPHLHFEVLIEGQPVDPVSTFGGSPSSWNLRIKS